MRFPSYTLSFLCTLQPHLTDAHAEHLKTTGGRITGRDQTVGLNYSLWNERGQLWESSLSFH